MTRTVFLSSFDPPARFPHHSPSPSCDPFKNVLALPRRQVDRKALKLLLQVNQADTSIKNLVSPALSAGLVIPWPAPLYTAGHYNSSASFVQSAMFQATMFQTTSLQPTINSAVFPDRSVINWLTVLVQALRHAFFINAAHGCL